MCASRTGGAFKRSYDRVSGIGIRDLPFVITWIFLFLFIILVGVLIVGSTIFSFGPTTGITLEKMIEIYTEPRTFQLLTNTLVIGLGAGLIGTLMTAVYTWIVVRTDIPGRKYLRMGAILTAGLPGIIMTFGWIAAFAPESGYINKISSALIGTHVFDIFTVWGIVLALSLSTLHSGFLLLETPFQNLSSELEEASRVSGYSRLQTLRKVSLPILFPALFSSFLLSTIYAIGNFEFVMFFTTFQGGMQTFATEIYSVLRLDNIPKYGEAALLSIPYMLLAMILITLYIYYTRKREKYVTVSGGGSRQNLIELGTYRYAGLGYCIFVWGMALIVPALGIVGLALSPEIGGAFTAITFENFTQFFSLNGVFDVFFNTIVFAFAGALGVVVFSTLIAYTALKYDHPLASIGDYASTIPLGLPPIVYGLAVFWMFLTVPGLNSFYGSIVPLIVAIIFMKTPHGVRIISSNMIQIDDELEEASRVCGRSWANSFRNITLPLTLDGISNAFLFVFIDSMKELAGIILLVGAGSDVFTNYIMGIYLNNPGALPDIAAGSIVFCLFIFGIIFVQTRLQGQSASREFLYS